MRLRDRLGKGSHDDGLSHTHEEDEQDPAPHGREIPNKRSRLREAHLPAVVPLAAEGHRALHERPARRVRLVFPHPQQLLRRHPREGRLRLRRAADGGREGGVLHAHLLPEGEDRPDAHGAARDALVVPREPLAPSRAREAHELQVPGLEGQRLHPGPVCIRHRRAHEHAPGSRPGAVHLPQEAPQYHRAD